MIPGVTYLPVPSMTTASDGASTVAPTAVILPFCTRTLPFRIVGPAAVMMLTLRMTSVRDGKGTYVLGKGSAFGRETPPRPARFGGTESLLTDCAGVGAGVGVVPAQPRAATEARTRIEFRTRM